MEVKDEDLIECLDEKIRDGKKLVERLKIMQGKVEGVDKLVRKINQEIRFLVKVRSSGVVKKEYLQSTNLIHLTAMVDCLFESKEPICVMQPFKDKNNERLEVDIVCKSGGTWIKVIARNARALTLISLGNGEYGQKSVLDQAEAYKKCAENHPYRYQTPEIVFYFACGVEMLLARKLENLGVIVHGKVVTNDESYHQNLIGTSMEEKREGLQQEKDAVSEDENNVTLSFQTLSSEVDSKDIKTLNLDVSTLLAYVSNMTNGHANFVYREPLLTGQAEWERSRPVKPLLDKLFQGKELLVCETAYKNFVDIVDIIGGPCETARAKELEKKIKIVEDAKHGRIIEKLCLGGKIKNRSRLVFATGESTKSITISANEGFVRAARMQGIECTVVLHEPRSLSEMKEKHATPLRIS
ncbi:UPF0415 protein C7orf25 homolog isoform X2 [Venturia canescens]|nr:UPF0415 protein C7orf25 homolog isoform X2 [Venturia canescens]XP_043279462.1 UPF0415 protein C7orf25 homolog isoform X2 [Venturia canescens]